MPTPDEINDLRNLRHRIRQRADGAFPLRTDQEERIRREALDEVAGWMGDLLTTWTDQGQPVQPVELPAPVGRPAEGPQCCLTPAEYVVYMMLKASIEDPKRLLHVTDMDALVETWTKRMNEVGR